MLDFLQKEKIDPELLAGIRAFREKYPVSEALAARVPKPRYHYYGKEVWQAAIAVKICFWQAVRPPAKMCWPKIWPWRFTALRGMFRFM